MASSRAKGFLKTTLRSGMPVLSPLLARGNRATRILTYHSVGHRDHEMNVLPSDFRTQMRWLRENHSPISLDAAIDGQPGVAVTFDDGYRDNLTEAAPILAEFEIPATVFVVPGRMGGHLDHDAPVEAARLMTWGELGQLRETGIAIGGHTLNHVRLSTLTAAEQDTEIAECTRILREKLGESPAAFAYPFGSALDYDAASIDAVQRAGYRFAVSNRYGPVEVKSSRWEVRRIWIDRTDTMRSFEKKVRGDLDGMVILDSALGIRARRIMNGLLGVS